MFCLDLESKAKRWAKVAEESCKVDNMENILTVGIVCISCSWRQAFFRDEEEIETFDMDNERLA